MNSILEFANREEFRNGYLKIVYQIMVFGFYLENLENQRQ